MFPVEFNIVYEDFSQDPYPTLSKLRKTAPISFVPQLGAILLSKHVDIFVCEKNISACFESRMAPSCGTNDIGALFLKLESVGYGFLEKSS